MRMPPIPDRTKKYPAANPGEGAVNIRANSSLRKLMRAARRGKIPDERLVIIEAAERKAAQAA